jgi:hypothetical protein
MAKAIRGLYKAVNSLPLPQVRKEVTKLFQTPFVCHPERSEGSQAIENAGFFTPLRFVQNDKFEDYGVLK